MARASSMLLLIVAVAVGCGCGGNGSQADDDDDDGQTNPDGSTPDGRTDPIVDAGPDASVDYPYSDLDVGCASIFRQSIVPEYHVTMAPDQWAAMEHEFMNPQFTAGGSIIEPGYHPAQIRIVEGGATHEPPGVMIRINGNTSWLQTIRDDDNPKMQFMVSFNNVDSEARFQGLRKVKLDMPRSDWTFIQQRVALAWLRGRAGIPAQCANSARVYINGTYYGLYTNAERQDKSFLKRVYGSNDNDGDLWKAGREIKTNEETFTWTRISAFWAIQDVAGLDQWTSLDESMKEWASEAVIGDTDGYNQGRPNYYLYDRPSTNKFVWLANDLDTAMDSDFLPANTTPVLAPTPEGEARWERDWHHGLIAFNDTGALSRYVAAMRTRLPRLDPAEVQMWIDDWSEQIAAAAMEDQHRSFTMTEHSQQLGRMKAYSTARRAYLQTWLDCWNSGGVDADGDGFDMCHDCRDADATQSPAAIELCDEIDNNCDGRVDNLAEGTCTSDPEAAAREAFWRRVNTDVKARARLDRLE